MIVVVVVLRDSATTIERQQQQEWLHKMKSFVNGDGASGGRLSFLQQLLRSRLVSMGARSKRRCGRRETRLGGSTRCSTMWEFEVISMSLDFDVFFVQGIGDISTSVKVLWKTKCLHGRWGEWESTNFSKVAELNITKELIGVIQGSIKMVTLCSQIKDHAIVGYILGIRVSPRYRRRGVATTLVGSLENWFIENKVDFAYMATERDNAASMKLFKDKNKFVDFRSLSMLIKPVSDYNLRIPNDVEIKNINIEIALELYKRSIMGSTEFFPRDVHDHHDDWEFNGHDHPRSWAVVSVWNSGKLFKLRVGNVPTSCLMSSMVLRYIDRVLPFLKIQVTPDLSEEFGFYFMYGVHGEGVNSGVLVKVPRLASPSSPA
ncbi:hypothetical protein Scep_005715 [Stephania cephalantha]|uniref:N-acetyltransferase domain-containing protein n=1 Tax=Stephania cephalantha TaxID=152367 RepID=A0AAP0KUU1_9MAGN